MTFRGSSGFVAMSTSLSPFASSVIWTMRPTDAASTGEARSTTAAMIVRAATAPARGTRIGFLLDIPPGGTGVHGGRTPATLWGPLYGPAGGPAPAPPPSARRTRRDGSSGRPEGGAPSGGGTARR